MSLSKSFEITEASLDDLDEITSLEAHGFPADEAASKEAVAYRLKSFPNWFLTAKSDNKIIGFINGILSDKELIVDDVYLPNSEVGTDGNNLLLFGLVVHADYRRKGIAESLMKAILEKAKNNGIKHAALTCREMLIPYYEKFGFTKVGVSDSVIGNVVWYDMVIKL